MKLRATQSPERAPRDRFSVLDFSEAAKIPAARARKLIKDFGNDAETLMRAALARRAMPDRENTLRPADGGSDRAPSLGKA